MVVFVWEAFSWHHYGTKEIIKVKKKTKKNTNLKLVCGPPAECLKLWSGFARPFSVISQ